MNRINIQTSLKTDEEQINFSGLGELDNNEIKFNENDVLVTICMMKNKLELVRASSEHTIRMTLSTSESTGTYDIKDLGLLELDIKTTNLEMRENALILEYTMNLQGNEMGTFNYELNYEVIE